jgi:hypothetical protein
MHVVLEDPDADWPGTLFLDSPLGVTLRLFNVAGITEVEKQKLATVTLPEVVREEAARRFCWLMPGWRHDVEPPAECLVLVFADKQRAESVIADVIRSRSRPPRLIRWRTATKATTGLFVDAARAALAAERS